MTDPQFKQLLNCMNRIETKVDKNTVAIKDLTKVVKKNHPGDFK